MFQIDVEGNIVVCEDCLKKLKDADMFVDNDMNESNKECCLCGKGADKFVTYIHKDEMPPSTYCYECGKKLKNAFKVDDTYFCGECFCNVVNDQVTDNDKSDELEDKISEFKEALSGILDDIQGFAETANDDWGHLK